MLLRRGQFVVTNIILQSKVPELLDSCVTNTLPVKVFSPHQRFPYIFSTNITYLRDGLLKIVQDFSVSCNIFYLWVRQIALSYVMSH